MGTAVKVIVVEDDLYLRLSTVEFLNLAGHEATGVGSALEFYQLLAERPFNVAVVDVGLPDQSGFVLAKYIRTNTTMSIIIVTARDTVEDRVKGYDAGADLYLVKPVDCRELSAAIASLAERQRAGLLTSPSSIPHEFWQVINNTWQLVPPEGNAIDLTSKEMQFLACLAATPGKAVHRDILLAALDYRSDEYANRALDSLVRRLRRKIEEKVPFCPIKTVHAHGYCFSAPVIIE